MASLSKLAKYKDNSVLVAPNIRSSFRGRGSGRSKVRLTGVAACVNVSMRLSQGPRPEAVQTALGRVCVEWPTVNARVAQVEAREKATQPG